MLNCYTARAEGQEDGIIIIARTGPQAADMFVVDHITKHGEAPPTFTVALNDLRQMPLLDDLRTMMKGDVTGVVEFDENLGHSLKAML